MPFGIITSAAANANKVAADIYDRIKTLSVNEDFRKRILKMIQELQQIADHLKSIEIDELPQICNLHIENVERSLQSCQQIIERLDSESTAMNLAQVNPHRQQLETLERELDGARSNLQLVLTAIITQQNVALKKCVESTATRTEAALADVYKDSGASIKGTKPSTLFKPKATVSGDLLEIKWSDSNNLIDSLDRYEVRYDDQNGIIIIPGNPHELKVKNERIPTFQLKLGPPILVIGKVYTIQVRAVNSEGPGEWSPSIICHFKLGPPDKPAKPRLSHTSPTTVELRTERLTDKEENGEPVTHCVVEYVALTDTENVTDWQRSQHEITPYNYEKEEFDVVCLIKDLTPDTSYTFRVKMVNKIGESQPSDSADICTNQPVPGPPQELRVSSKRTSQSIKIRWNPPIHNTQGAQKYYAEYQRAKTKKTSKWHEFTTIGDKLSATATGLKTDTKYKFRVRAVNNKGEYGDFSEVVVGETRYGKFGKTVVTTGAFIGGTVGAPVLGAIALGGIFGAVSAESVDNKVGKVAAATAAGIGGGIGGALSGTFGAPVYGGIIAHTVYERLGGADVELSPQTSDDEDTTEQQLYT